MVAARRAASSITRSPALSHVTTSRGLVSSGVVDVEPRAVGEDHVGQPGVVLGVEVLRAERRAQVEAAGVPQRRLLLEVPPGAPGPRVRLAAVGVHDLRGEQHLVRPRLARHRDAVLHLGAHHAPYRHDTSVVEAPDTMPVARLVDQPTPSSALIGSMAKYSTNAAATTHSSGWISPALPRTVRSTT